MKKNINNLHNIEEWHHLTLSNCSYLIGKYQRDLEKYANTNESSLETETFSQIMSYYQDKLIPALDEMIQLGEKHVDTLITANPERKFFTPIKSEVLAHEAIINNFYERFCNLQKEVVSFLHNKRKNHEKIS